MKSRTKSVADGHRPTLTVIMPAMEIDTYFYKTMESMQQQTFQDFELIICCLMTQFEKFSNFLSAHDIRGKVLGSRLDGISYAANKCIEESSGDFIARWDADDICDQHRFEAQLKFLLDHPEVGVVGTRVNLIDEDDKPVLDQFFKFYECDRDIRRAMRFRQPLLHSSLIFRREILFGIKGYLYGHTSEDHELFLRLARSSNVRFHNLSSVTTYYRRRRGQLSQIRSKRKQFADIISVRKTII